MAKRDHVNPFRKSSQQVTSCHVCLEMLEARRQSASDRSSHTLICLLPTAPRTTRLTFTKTVSWPAAAIQLTMRRITSGFDVCRSASRFSTAGATQIVPPRETSGAHLTLFSVLGRGTAALLRTALCTSLCTAKCSSYFVS